MPSKKSQKEIDQKASLGRKAEGKKMFNGKVPVINGGFTSGGDTMWPKNITSRKPK